jgi:Icc-related predicted phosphoesterase
MKILHTSDLHGYQAKYGKVLKHATQRKVDVVVLPGDLLTGRDPLIAEQRKFCQWLRDWMYTLTERGIHVVYILGNDDLAIMDKVMLSYVRGNPMVHWIDGQATTIGDYTFVGMSQVKDLPYGLKDRARLDYDIDDPLDIFQPHTAYLSQTDYSGDEFVEMPVERWVEHVKTLPTLAKMLWRLPVEDWSKTVLVTHDPPFGIGLDMTANGEQVGSKAVLEFIEDTQPYLTLHGHIHESPNRTGIWRAEVNNTVCVQVGQPWRDLSAAIIDLETREVERILDKIT